MGLWAPTTPEQDTHIWKILTCNPIAKEVPPKYTFALEAFGNNSSLIRTVTLHVGQMSENWKASKQEDPWSIYWDGKRAQGIKTVNHQTVIQMD